MSALLRAAVEPRAHAQRFIVADAAVTWREFYSELFGNRVAELPSYSRADLIAMRQSGAPSLRDLVHVISTSPEVRRILREHRYLAAIKTLGSRWLPATYARLRHATADPTQSTARAAPTPARPPEYLADLFGPSRTRFSSARAREILSWKPEVDLPRGQERSRVWLRELGLINGGL